MDKQMEEQEAPMVSLETPVDPKEQQQIEAYLTGLSKMLHGKETSGDVLAMLQSGEPGDTIPQAALSVNSQMEAATSKGGSKPSLNILLNAAAFLVSDLIEIGNAADIFLIESEEEIAPILRSTLQAYIEKGLADGTIDPVELQQVVEPLMDEEHKALGSEAALRSGLPQEPNQGTAMHQYGEQQKRAGEQEGMKKVQQQGALRGGM